MMQGIKNTSNDTFGRLMGNGLHYEVPKYQRDYSWDKEQWSDLWYDLMQMIDEKDSHYMGYLVLQTADAPLSQVGIAALRVRLGHHCDFFIPGQMQGAVQPRASTARNQNIRFHKSSKNH